MATLQMHKTIWVFARGHELLRVERCHAPAGLTVIRHDGRRQDYTGHSDSELARIHTRLEVELRRDGWTLEQFTAERRQGMDRRNAPRDRADRRKTR